MMDLSNRLPKESEREPFKFNLPFMDLANSLEYLHGIECRTHLKDWSIMFRNEFFKPFLVF